MNNHRSIELNELFKAMSLAQSEIKVAVKDSENPFFKSKYANLQMIIESSRPALCKNNLTVMQQIVPNENGIDTLVTMLCHSSGQWISSQIKITPIKTDIQSLGSYITYLRRYCYASLVGVYDGTSDDDGDSASHEQKKIESKKITAEQYKVLFNIDQEIRQAILTSYKVQSIHDLTEEQADIIIKKYL